MNTNQHDLSRRTFLGGVAGGIAVGTATAGANDAHAATRPPGIGSGAGAGTGAGATPELIIAPVAASPTGPAWGLPG